ncbi:MAG: hypothetical protein IPP41_04650 [Rhodocyclaceae bacterium]|nr:hypothetical protein [Rhodocyclaceae bacterium]
MTLLYFGSRRHFDLSVAPRNWIIFGTVCLAVITLVPVVSASYQLRSTVLTTYAATALSLHARVIYKHGDPIFAYRFTAFIIATEAVITILRLISFFFMIALT